MFSSDFRERDKYMFFGAFSSPADGVRYAVREEQVSTVANPEGGSGGGGGWSWPHPFSENKSSQLR